MSTHKLLIVEDDPNMGSLMNEMLRVKGFDTEWCQDGESALAAFLEGNFDLCILDVMLPKKDGFTLAEDIRKQDPHTPILFLTARNLIEDKEKGFGIGGDDYLTKPFSMVELQLRVNALLRRSGNAGAPRNEAATEFQIGRYHFDYPTRQLTLDGAEGKRITSREAELLRLLCLNMNDILERSIALKQIWGDDGYFNARSMDVFITKLRKHLKGDPAVEIMNVHGMGYKLLVSA
ncbi:MAG: response regulator transcription factor [Bacteroidota bacterium]